MSMDLTAIASQSDIVEAERVPLDQRLTIKHTYEALTRSAAEYGDRLALQFLPQGNAEEEPITVSYRQFLARVTQTANLLHQLGVCKDDAVSFLLPNLPQTHFAIWGGEAAGIVNPINPLLEPDQIAGIMQAAEAKVLIALGPTPNPEIWRKVEAVASQVPSLETVLRVDLTPGSAAPEDLGRIRVLNFDQEIAKQPADRLSSGREIQSDDIASYFHTGGTTGAPKIAEHTHMNEVFDAWAASQNITIGPGKVMFCGLPLFHVNAVVVTGLIPWGNGAAVVLGTPQGYRGEGVIKNFWKIVDKYRLNFFSGVPALFSALMDVPTGNSDISSLEFALCGAAPMPVDLFRRFEEKTNVSILEGYGLTEAACISSVNPPYGDRRVGSIGFRLPHQQMKTVLVDEECKYQRDCESEEIGLVVV